MATLDDLLNSGLSGIISSGGLPTADALYNVQQQADRENTFGRGLGISTVTRDALAKARVDATLAAENAQLTALGQAASLQQGAANRASAEAMQNKALGQQRSLANQQMLAQGLGGAAGAAAQIGGMAFAPEIRNNLRDLFGVGGPRSPRGGQEVMAPPGSVPGGASASAAPDLISGAGGPSVPSIPDLSTPDFGSSYSASTPDFSLGVSPQFDLSSLYDFSLPQSFSPGYDWSSVGWA